MSPASITFGDSLGIPENLITMLPPCGEPCTLSTTVSPEHLSFFRAPITGTIVRRRIETVAGSTPQMIKFRVIAPVPGDDFMGAPTEAFTGAGSSEASPVPTSAGTSAFPTRLPVLAGDFIGLDTEGEALAAVAVEEESIRVFKPPLTDFGSPAPGTREDYALLVNADVVAPPTSSAVSTCSRSGGFPVTVTPDPDPAVAAKALHLRTDSSAEALLPSGGDPGVTSVSVGPGAHRLEYWGEDTLGQQERPHHTASVFVDSTPLTIAISSDQGKDIYAQDEPASITIAARDTLDGLQSDPSGAHVAIATRAPGTYTITRTAADRCGNTAAASFTYTVTSAAKITRLRVRPSSFPASRSGSAITRTRSGAGLTKTGTEVSYSDSLAAITTFTVQRPARGMRKGGRCLAPSEVGHHARRCTRFVNVGSFSRADRAGTNRFRFTGRINNRALSPGAYRLRARASVPGGEAGVPAYVAFHISH